jgi:hypothetical protein
VGLFNSKYRIPGKKWRGADREAPTGAQPPRKPRTIRVGTCLFDGVGPRIATGDHYASAGMLTLRPDYLAGLLTAATGTSMAAPQIAFKAMPCCAPCRRPT